MASGMKTFTLEGVQTLHSSALQLNKNSIQFNSISIYLCAKLNSHRPITKLAQVVQRRRRRSKELES
jgi:hypothetical protein